VKRGPLTIGRDGRYGVKKSWRSIIASVRALLLPEGVSIVIISIEGGDESSTHDTSDNLGGNLTEGISEII